MNLWTALERAFNEQLAGITPPNAPHPETHDQRERLREATPLPLFHAHPPTEL